MGNPMIIWYGIVGAVLLACLYHLLCYIHESRKERGSEGRNLFGFYKERDIFYTPGDVTPDDDDYDDEL